MSLFSTTEEEQPKKAIAPDFSAKLGEAYSVRLSAICARLKITKTEFLKKRIDETWYKLECQLNLFEGE